MVVLDQGGDLAQAIGHYLEHRAPQVFGHGLLEPCHPRAPTQHALTLVGRQLTGNDTQQGGLALAVATDQADALAVLDRQRDAIEQGGVGKGQVNVAQGQQGHEGNTTLGTGCHIRTSAPGRQRPWRPPSSG